MVNLRENEWMDGDAFAGVLRQRGLQATIPVIVLSADVNAQQNANQSGTDSYISRPFDVYDLSGEISHLMEHLIPVDDTQNQQVETVPQSPALE
jgi:CheY-like chemotaxis protein